MSTERTIYHQYRTIDHLYMVESKRGGTKYVVKVFDIFQRNVLNKVFPGSCKVLGEQISVGRESTLQFLREILPQEYLPKAQKEITKEECCDDIHRMIYKYKSNVVEEPQDLKDWVCPITLEMFSEPVDDEHGHTFEKAAIEEYLKTSNKCPLSREPITSASLRPNRRVQEEIEKRRNNSIPNFSLFEKEKVNMALRHLKMAQALTEEQEYEEALFSYGQAFRFTRSWIDYAKIPLLYEKIREREKATLAYLHLALYQLEDGKNRQALQTLEKCSQNKELSMQVKLLQSKIYELQGEKEKALQLQIQEVEELSKQNPKEAILLCKKILNQEPEHLELYQILANLLENSLKKSHILLKGATHAIAMQDHNMAGKLCAEVERTSFEDTLVIIEVLQSNENSSAVKEELLSSAANIFEEREMFRDMLKASKMLFQNNPTAQYCEKIVRAYEKLEKPQNQLKWAIILLGLLTKEENWSKAEEIAKQALQQVEEVEKIALYEKLEIIYSEWHGHKLSNLLTSLGKAYLQNNQLEAAEKTYRRAFKQFHTFEHIICLAETLKEKGEIKQSVRTYYEASSIALLKEDYQNLSSCVEKIKDVDPNLQELSLNERMLLLTQVHILSLSAKVEVLEGALIKTKEIDLSCAFGKADWEKYFGEIGEGPPLPSNIGEVLKSPCPFWEGNLVEETHILVLVPKTVNGVPLTLNLLGELIKAPKQGFATQNYTHKNIHTEFGGMHVSSAHWVLLTKDVIPNSKNKNYANYCNLIASHGDYEIPKLLDVVVGILMHYARTGERLYSFSPNTYTGCKEVSKNGKSMIVGGFSPGGLSFYDHYDCLDNYVGVGGSRKF